MIYLSFLIFVCVFVEQKTCRKVGLFSLYGQLFLIFNEHWCKLKLLEYARSRRVVFFGKYERSKYHGITRQPSEP